MRQRAIAPPSAGSKRPRKPPRVRFSVRGVEILDHPRNKPELVGTVVPWERVSASAFIMAPGFVLLDKNHKPIAKRVAVDDWGVSVRALRRIARVRQRLADRTFRRGEFEYSVNTPPTRRERLKCWSAACVPFGLFIALLAVMVASAGPPSLTGYPLWLQIASVAAMVTLPALQAAIVAVMTAPWVGLARRNARHARIVPWVIEAELVSGERVAIDFRDVDRVRYFGRYCSIRSRHGPTISMDLKDSGAGWVIGRLQAHVDRHGPPRPQHRLARALSVLTMLALVVGVVAAHRAGLLPGVSLLGMLLMLAGTSALMYGLVWYAQRLRARAAREPAPWAFSSKPAAS